MAHDLSRYGGYITNISFNFQVGSQLSSASVTIISEDGNYIEPKLGSRFIMPFDLGFSMTINETRIERTGSSKTLRVDLVDNSIQNLDLNLVLVRGEQTTGVKKTDQDTRVSEAKIYNLLDMPEDAWPNYILNKNTDRGEFFDTPSRNPSLLNGTNNVWIIGGGKSVFTPTNMITYPVQEENYVRWKTFDPKDEKEFFLVFKDKDFKENLSEFGDEDIINKGAIIKNNAADVSLQFGYTAKEFRTLLFKLGVRIDDSAGYLNNEYILFDSAGTVRDCLAAIASKLGFFFYYDMSKSGGGGTTLVILGNKHITNINKNIKKLEANTGPDAVALSSTQTMKGLDAKHVLIKGEISEKQSTRTGGYSGMNNIGKKTPFKRVPLESLFAQSEKVNNKVLNNFFSLFLSTAKDEQNLFDAFVYAYHQGVDLFPPIGELYDEAHCALVDRIEFNLDSYTANPRFEEEAKEFKGINIAGQAFAYNLTRNKERKDGKLKDLKDKGQIPIPPSNSGFYKVLKLFYDFMYSVYISSAVPSYKAGQMDFSDPAYTVSGTFSSTDKVKDVPVFSELMTTLDDYKMTEEPFGDVTVGALATAAGIEGIGDRADNIVGERLFFIAVRNAGDMLPNRTKLEKEQADEFGVKIDKLIRDNIAVVSVNESTKLITSEKVDEVANFVVDSSERLHKEFRDENQQTITLTYTRKNDQDNIDFDQNFDESSVLKPNKYSLNHIPDGRTKTEDMVEKISLVYINGPKKDTDLFLENATSNINEYSLVPIFKGPMRILEVQYSRPPNADDFDPTKGVDSMSVNISDNGVSTSIKYSAKKYLALDQGVLINDERVARAISPPPQFSSRQKTIMSL